MQEGAADQAAPFAAFAEEIEASIAEGNGSFLTESLDLKALVEQISTGLDVSPRFKEIYLKALTNRMALGEETVESNASGNGTYEFLRMMPDRPKRALFRHLGHDGLNYHELHMRRGVDGGVRVVDFYMYNLGERYSTILRRGFLAQVTHSNGSLLSGLPGDESDYIASLEEILELVALQVDDPAGALEIYEGLPESVQQLPEILSMRIEAASVVDEDVYLRALLDFAKFHPDSPAVALMMIEANAVRAEYKRALANVDVIDDRVLGDPYLDIFRGSIWLLAGEQKKAEKRVDRAVDRDPGLGYQALWMYLDIAMVARDHPKTLRCLVTLESDYSVEWGDLTEIQEYAPFLASASGKKWLKRD